METPKGLINYNLIFYLLRSKSFANWNGGSLDERTEFAEVASRGVVQLASFSWRHSAGVVQPALSLGNVLFPSGSVYRRHVFSVPLDDCRRSAIADRRRHGSL